MLLVRAPVLVAGSDCRQQGYDFRIGWTYSKDTEDLLSSPAMNAQAFLEPIGTTCSVPSQVPVIAVLGLEDVYHFLGNSEIGDRGRRKMGRREVGQVELHADDVGLAEGIKREARSSGKSTRIGLIHGCVPLVSWVWGQAVRLGNQVLARLQPAFL